MSKSKKVAITLAVFAVLALATAVWAYEIGSIHVNKNTSAYKGPNNVRNANDHGCNDYWADFYYVNENKLNSLGVWATNWINQAHINNHNGLDGFYECTGGLCNVHLCTKNTLGANAWSVRLYE